MPTRRILPDKACLRCGALFNRSRLRGGRLEEISDYQKRKFCGIDCYRLHNRGSNHANFKNGTKSRPDGYLRNSQTDQYIHREVMEAHLGRKLLPEEHVHHIDEDKANNDISNLEIVSNSQHRKIHSRTCKRDRRGRFAK